MEKPLSEFNKEDYVEQEIKPIVEKLVDACLMYDLPLFVSVCYKNDETGSYYYNNAVSARVKKLNLKDDTFWKLIRVTLGDTVTTKEQDEDFELTLHNKYFDNDEETENEGDKS